MLVLLLAFIVVAGLFARRNFVRGRADVKGALRLFTVLTICFCLSYLLDVHFAPLQLYLWSQLLFLAVPMLFSLLAWVGYMAVEPYVRRTWPHVMVSWQRLLNGCFRDPLIGRDLLLGIFAGFVFSLLASCVERLQVNFEFGRGALSSIAFYTSGIFTSCFVPLLILALLSGLTGLLRRKWLGLLATGLLFAIVSLQDSTGGTVANLVQVVLVLLVLTRVGLLATVSYFLGTVITAVPPLIFSQWYVGRALIGLVAPVALLIYGLLYLAGESADFRKGAAGLEAKSVAPNFGLDYGRTVL
jgi:hypothetical protein